MHVLFRQHYACNACARLLHPDAFDIDHVVELCDGGGGGLDNLQALCVLCHRLKTARNRRLRRQRACS